MAGLLAIVLFIIWFRRTGRKLIEQEIIRQAYFRTLADDSSREDYFRANQERNERFPNGFGQDLDGSGGR